MLCSQRIYSGEFPRVFVFIIIHQKKIPPDSSSALISPDEFPWVETYVFILAGEFQGEKQWAKKVSFWSALYKLLSGKHAKSCMKIINFHLNTPVETVKGFLQEFVWSRLKKGFTIHVHCVSILPWNAEFCHSPISLENSSAIVNEVKQCVVERIYRQPCIRLQSLTN